MLRSRDGVGRMRQLIYKQDPASGGISGMEPHDYGPTQHGERDENSTKIVKDPQL